ncbi:hypothetical protein JTE90_003701 [Oedothorax gibbosus]|uniref:Uncharacterized protein n=1 Tax=Oedothorax gibbosus TaxID=931172 RepID=A0AAV6VRL9_9ARAC|nr:hypothetical protein JTE90_003701 [Oedothorax gibbosus]
MRKKTYENETRIIMAAELTINQNAAVNWMTTAFSKQPFRAKQLPKIWQRLHPQDIQQSVQSLSVKFDTLCKRIRLGESFRFGDIFKMSQGKLINLD